MELLGWWLMLVGTLRLASVWFGFVDIWALRLAVFSKTTNQEFKLVYWAEGLSETVALSVKMSHIGRGMGRLVSVYGLGQTSPQELAFGVELGPVTEVHGRTFGVWTLLTCTLCYLCAFNLHDRPLYLATILSFVYAFGHFLTEFLIYQTMAIKNLVTVGIFAGTSIVWMLLQWNAHQQVKTKSP
ncbi:hypothetical protein MTR67_020617 [Solanum verrucosum]|uniref:Ergosterol biosynthetic protein 28 n=1 Tax=Solanum verrucosum TaxID=315347 RepID=A0AAF0TNV4_SOLVR|nr:hypothetical protein MTR67_020617 [Solanum verrucosum]